MTRSETVTRPGAPTNVSQRRLTIGLCVNIIAIAFETIAVATAMPVAARDLNGLAYYAWSFSAFGTGSGPPSPCWSVWASSSSASS